MSASNLESGYRVLMSISYLFMNLCRLLTIDQKFNYKSDNWETFNFLNKLFKMLVKFVHISL